MLLPTTQHATLVANDGFVAVRLGQNEIVRKGGLRRRNDFLTSRIKASVANIFGDRIVKQKCFLRHHSHSLAKRVLGDIPQIMPIDPNNSALRIVKTQNERQNRAFAGSTRPHKSIFFSGLDLKTHPLHGGLIRTIVETHVIKIKPPLGPAHHNSLWAIHNAGLPVHKLEHIHCRDHALLHLHRNTAEIFDRLVEHEYTPAKCCKFDETDVGVVNIDHRQDDTECGHAFNQWVNDIRTAADPKAVSELRVARLRKLLGLVVLTGETFDHPDPCKSLLKNHRHLSGFSFLCLSRLAYFAPKINHRKNAQRKQNQGSEAEFPINRDKHTDLRQNSDRILNDIG